MFIKTGMFAPQIHTVMLLNEKGGSCRSLDYFDLQIQKSVSCRIVPLKTSDLTCVGGKMSRREHNKRTRDLGSYSPAATKTNGVVLPPEEHKRREENGKA